MKQLIAMLAGWLARALTKEIALRQGLQLWAADLLSYLAGVSASALALRL